MTDKMTEATVSALKDACENNLAIIEPRKIILALLAERNRLREALKPFAGDPMTAKKIKDDQKFIGFAFVMGDLRRARTALGE